MSPELVSLTNERHDLTTTPSRPSIVSFKIRSFLTLRICTDAIPLFQANAHRVTHTLVFMHIMYLRQSCGIFLNGALRPRRMYLKGRSHGMVCTN